MLFGPLVELGVHQGLAFELAESRNRLEDVIVRDADLPLVKRRLVCLLGHLVVVCENGCSWGGNDGRFFRGFGWLFGRRQKLSQVFTA